MSPTDLPDPLRQDGTYPRPQLLRSDWCDLGGVWDFAFGEETGNDPSAVAFDRTIVVPYPPEAPLSGIGDTGYHPVVWYRREFGQEELVRAGLEEGSPKILLHFGAVDYSAEIWLNGRLVGRHEGGQTPFQFDITREVDVLGRNELVVRAVDDPLDVGVPRGKQDWREDPHAIWYHRTTGIWQSVWLECVPPVHITRLAWEADVPGAAVDLELTLSARPTDGTRAHLVVDHEGELLAEATFRLLETTSHLRLGLPRQRNGQQYEELLWSPAHPRLLSARVTLSTGADGGDTATGDAVSSYFGLRTVGSHGPHFLLNDRPLYLRAVLSQNYWPESHLAAPSADALRHEVETILACGFNAARVHQKAEDPRFLYWADRLGLLVWAETASAYEFSSRSVQLLTQEWMELVRRDVSHPSVIVWVPLNESWGVQHIAHDPHQQAFSRSISELTRALDGTRPVVSNDGWEHTDSDLWTIHDYEGDPAMLEQRYASEQGVAVLLGGVGPAGRRMSADGLAPIRPIMLTEFGGVSWIDTDVSGAWGYSSARDSADFERRVEGLMAAVIASPVLAGFCYTQLTDTGQETNGLLRADRSPKIPLQRLRSIVEGSEAPAPGA